MMTRLSRPCCGMIDIPLVLEILFACFCSAGDRRNGVRLRDRDSDCGFCSPGWRSLCLFESFRLRHRSSCSQRNLGRGKSAPQNPQQLQGRGEITSMEGLSRRHSDRDNSLKQNDAYTLVNISSVPKMERIIGPRFVFKQKPDGRFKARLVVQGHVQERGNDYGRSYAPVCRIGSIRTLLAIVCEHGWPVWQMDGVGAFLQSLIDNDAFVNPAPGHDLRDSKTGEVMVYKLQCSLYGLAQSPVLRYDTIDGVLVVIGFRPTQ